MNVTSRNDRAELSLVCPLGLYDNIHKKERASVLNQKATGLFPATKRASLSPRLDFALSFSSSRPSARAVIRQPPGAVPKTLATETLQEYQ